MGVKLDGDMCRYGPGFKLPDNKNVCDNKRYNQKKDSQVDTRLAHSPEIHV